MKKRFLLPALASLIATPAAIAFQQGDIVVRGGLVSVNPDDSSSNIIVGGSDLGVNLSVDNNMQLGLNFAYFISDRINIEILAATPFKHDVNFGVVDPLGTGNQLGEVTHLPPTLSLNYYLVDSDSQFQPYVGLGVNYTLFFDEGFTGANQDVGLSDLSLDNSLGLAAQVGVDYMIDDNWMVNGSIRWIDIETEASFSLNEAQGTVDQITIDPWVYMLSVGYRF